MLPLPKFFLDERCFQLCFNFPDFFLVVCLFVSFFFFPLLKTAVQKQRKRLSFAHGLFTQEIRRQVMKLRVEGSVS